MGNVPDESVNLLYRVLNLVIGVGRLDSQLEDQPVELVYDECDLDTLLESVSDDLFCIYHNLRRQRMPHSISLGERTTVDVNGPLRERLRQAEYHQPT